MDKDKLKDLQEQLTPEELLFLARRVAKSDGPSDEVEILDEIVPKAINFVALGDEDFQRLPEVKSRNRAFFAGGVDITDHISRLIKDEEQDKEVKE